METMRRKYPIGIQTFEEIIKGGYIYVDKTDLIHQLVCGGKYYFLSRPRRFGKSLLTTTLEAYFEGKKDLFKGLAMEKLEKDWISYPVFHLDFSGATYINPEAITNRLEVVFQGWEKKYGANPAEKEYGDRLSGLMSRAFEQTGRQSVVLIDEYDKPLTDTIGKPEMQDHNRSVLQGLYGVLKNADRDIKFAFLTGVTRYGKLGIFSANNNPNDISMIPAYSSICGISETELKSVFRPDIEHLASSLEISGDTLEQLLKRRYDGYHFSYKGEGIYNPFSILKTFDNEMLANHWFATGTPTYLTVLLKKADFNPAQLEGEIVASEESLSSFGTGESNIIAALYQSGYLTIKSYDGNFYTLTLPNEEVAFGLTNYLIPDYTGTNFGDFDPEIIELRRLLREGDAEGMMEQLRDIMEEIPFENNEPKMLEAHFRNMVYLMIRATGYPTHVEMPKLGGRIDICFETENYTYIIECKRDTPASEALAQIEEKRDAKWRTPTSRTLYRIGANFSTKEKNLTEWKIA